MEIVKLGVIFKMDRERVTWEILNFSKYIRNPNLNHPIVYLILYFIVAVVIYLLCSCEREGLESKCGRL